MKWSIRDGLCKDENGSVVAIMPPLSDEINEKIIESAPEIISSVQGFILRVNSGKLKPKTAVKEFAGILEKHDLLRRTFSVAVDEFS